MNATSLIFLYNNKKNCLSFPTVIKMKLKDFTPHCTNGGCFPIFTTRSEQFHDSLRGMSACTHSLLHHSACTSYHVVCVCVALCFLQECNQECIFLCMSVCVCVCVVLYHILSISGKCKGLKWRFDIGEDVRKGCRGRRQRMVNRKDIGSLRSHPGSLKDMEVGGGMLNV